MASFVCLSRKMYTGFPLQVSGFCLHLLSICLCALFTSQVEHYIERVESLGKKGVSAWLIEYTIYAIFKHRSWTPTCCRRALNLWHGNNVEFFVGFRVRCHRLVNICPAPRPARVR